MIAIAEPSRSKPRHPTHTLDQYVLDFLEVTRSSCSTMGRRFIAIPMPQNVGEPGWIQEVKS